MLQICELLKMCATYGDYFLLLGLLPLPCSKKTQLGLNEEFESFCYFFLSAGKLTKNVLHPMSEYSVFLACSWQQGQESPMLVY